MTLDELTKQAENIIPAKFYFQIGEVCKLTQLPKSVLRFWESEFVSLKPGRTESGRRLYRRKDVVLLFKIKYLLYESKFTIEGARKVLECRGKNMELPDNEDLFAEPDVVADVVAPVSNNTVTSAAANATAVSAEALELIKRELLAIRRLLDHTF